MVVDLINAKHLVKGESYLVRLPDNAKDSLVAIHAGLEEFSKRSGVLFLVLLESDIVVTQIQADKC